jgi:hypothetical protein
MQASTNVLNNVADEISEVKKTKSRLSAKLIQKMRDENIREDREAV